MKESMNPKKRIDIFGVALAIGIGLGYFFTTSAVLALSYYLLLTFVSCVRVYLFYKTPKHERRIYHWNGLSWGTAFILHPVSQMGIIIFILFSAIIAIIMSHL